MVKRTNVRDFREPTDQLESENQKSLTERSESNNNLPRFPRAIETTRRVAKSKIEEGETIRLERY